MHIIIVKAITSSYKKLLSRVNVFKSRWVSPTTTGWWCAFSMRFTLALRQEQGAWIYADGNGSAMPLAGASVA